MKPYIETQYRRKLARARVWCTSWRGLVCGMNRISVPWYMDMGSPIDVCDAYIVGLREP